ncbi:hypothetical protein JCM19047_2482 [Bacillus sp. JCM 19047]|nr:hypothetical protein JCM19047_2482 [Bacillus sp. JCM 19047]
MLSIFKEGEYFPPVEHEARIERYRINETLFKGEHYDIFKQLNYDYEQMGNNYTPTNLPGLICRKAADFLFGDAPSYSAGSTDYAEEQKVLERLVETNDLNKLCYESAVSNAYRGDAFLKVRWGQEFDGLLDAEGDPYRIFIESQIPHTFIRKHYLVTRRKYSHITSLFQNALTSLVNAISWMWSNIYLVKSLILRSN